MVVSVYKMGMWLNPLRYRDSAILSWTICNQQLVTTNVYKVTCERWVVPGTKSRWSRNSYESECHLHNVSERKTSFSSYLIKQCDLEMNKIQRKVKIRVDQRWKGIIMCNLETVQNFCPMGFFCMFLCFIKVINLNCLVEIIKF